MGILKRRLLISCLLMLGIVETNTLSAKASPNTTNVVTESDSESIDISGIVTDKNGEPLIGATVQQKGTTRGVVTNVEGKFSLKSRKGAELLISYIGYGTKTIPVSTERISNIVLEEDTEMLSEVVVVGYGTQKKINLSGAVDQLNAKELEKKPISDISKGLQGMIPNLNIDFTSGEPGKTANINVRGETSINGGTPLILIDGVASESDELNRLLPEDIESISVLKDASSAAIYGARAAFGVILVTTKHGEGDRVKVSYNNNFAWKRPSQLTNKTSDPYIYLKLKNIAVLNTPWSSGHVTNDERLEWARQRSDNPSGTESVRLNPEDQTQWDYMGNTDWTKHILDKSTFSQSHQVSISGATNKTDFYLSGGFENEDGAFSRIVNKDDYNRYNMRSKVGYKIWDWLKVSNNTSFVTTKRERPSYYNIGDIYDAEPWNVDKNPDGTWANTELGETLAQLVDGGDEKDVYKRLQSSFSTEMNFFDRSLLVNANYTITSGHRNYDWFKTKYSLGYGPNDIREKGTSRAYKANTVDTYNVLELFATYNKTFNQNHDITAIAGFNQEYYQWNEFTADRYDIISNSLPTIGLSSGDQYVNETYKDWAIRGLFFRTNYSYNGKYILEFNGRYDGTSRFPKNSRFGFFPSGSAAWRIDSESFFEPLRRYVSQLKLRASVGSLGNQLVSEYGYIPSMSSKLGGYLIDGAQQQIVTSPGLVSADYTWEKVNTFNLGADVSFYDNRINVNFDIYRRDTKGMLTLGKELPAVLGTSEPKENAADLKTTGWELSVGYRDSFAVASKPFNVGLRFVLSDNRSWITRFDNPTKNLNQYYEGMEIGEIWGLQSDGFFRTEEEIAALDESAIIPWGALSIVPGWPKYKDLDGDGAITKGTTATDPKDLSIIGNSAPRFRYGINLSADWNGFDFSAFLQGIGKRDFYPVSFLYWSFYQQPYSGGQVHAFDFYRPTDDDATAMAQHSQAYINAGLASQNLNAKYPVFQSWLADKNLGTGINAMGCALPQTGYMLNGAYLRVKNITLGYTLPETITEKIGINRLRLYVSADNLCEWSELKKYFDPEAVTQESSFGYVYPFNRQYSFGLNITF